MIHYAVQWHRAPLPPHVDESDLEWTTWSGHDDYLDEVEANEAAREFDAAFDGAYVHRVVARRVAGPSVARTTPSRSSVNDSLGVPRSHQGGRTTR